MKSIKAAKRDELHVGLDIPKQASIEVYNWVQEQDWPKGTELEPLEDYHITMLFAQGGGAGNYHDADWIKHDSHAVTVKGLKEFPPSKERDGLHPIVMLMDSNTIHEHHNALAEAAGKAGIDPGPYAKDKYAPHMTIGYGPSLPKGLKPPKLTFETAESSVSTPREEDSTEKKSWHIGQARAPYEAELLKLADSWNPKDQWPNALRERSSEPTDVDCACKNGHKLDCPVHGMHPTLPTYDDTLEFPDPSSPVGYDYHTDAPRTWMRAETKVSVRIDEDEDYDNELRWEEGTEGKGLVTRDGVVYTWTPNSFGEPHHPAYAEERGIAFENPSSFDINPDGSIKSDDRGAEQIALAADNRFHSSPVRWNFQATISSASHQPLWLPGSWDFRSARISTNKKLWVDDTRRPPDDSWDWAKDASEAKKLAKDNDYDLMSLDHDLGIVKYEGKVVINPDALSGGDFALWLHEHRKHMPKSVNIHSHNGKGTDLMKEILEKHTDVTTDRAADDLEEDWAREFKVHEPSEIEKEVVHLPEHTAAHPNGYFHSAPTEERSRILQHGLQPSKPTGFAGWEHQPQGVYVYDEPFTEGAQEMDQWHIPAEQVKEIEPDPLLPEAWVIKHPVHPSLYRGGPENDAEWDRLRRPLGKTASHQLAWLPGSNLPGKGLVTPSGDVHTWPVDKHGIPHHAEYVDQRQPYQLGEGSAHFFQIRPRGGLDTKGYNIPANVINHVLQTVPSLRAGEHTDWHFAKMTPPQQERFRAGLEDEYGPEHTPVLHRFADGWTVRHLPTWNEMGREGEMMHHCWSGFGSGEGAEPVEDNQGHMTLSLRDQNNWPHASFSFDPSDRTPFSIGVHGGEMTDDEEDPHVQRIQEFAQQYQPQRLAADQWDTREYPDVRMMPPMTQAPDATNPHPEAHGCTCPEGEKLTCPVHGLNPDPTQQGYDHSWSIPQNAPVGYPQDQPKSYQLNTGNVKHMKAEGSVWDDNGDQNDTEAHGQADESSATHSAYDGRESDQEDGIEIDHEYSVACDCPNCTQRREHSWHIQGPGTSDEGWSGLPRAEGSLSQVPIAETDEDEHQDDLQGENVPVPTPPADIRKKRKEREDLELVQESPMLHSAAWTILLPAASLQSRLDT